MKHFPPLEHPYSLRLQDFSRKCHLPINVKPIRRGEHPADYVHDHDFTEIVVVTAGHALHKIDGMVFPITRGDILIVYPGIRHSYGDTKTLGLTNILYRPEELPLPILDSYELSNFRLFLPTGQQLANPELVLHPVVKLNAALLRKVEALLSTLQWELKRNNPGGSFYSMALFMQLLTLLGRASTPDDSLPDEVFWLNGVLGYLKLHFRENVTAKELAEIAHVSERTLFHHFKEMTGSTPHQYIIMLRLAKAQELLRDTMLPITQIATDVGFADNCHLTREFREEFKCTPRQFRKKCRAESASAEE